MHPTPEQLIEMASSGETIGQAAFNAYRAHRCGVNHDGSPTPETSRVETSLLARLAAEVRALRAKNADLSERLALSELELRQSRT